MALTQIKTGAIADNAITEDKILNDAVTAAKIPANAIGASELADNAVDTAAIADNAVTQAKVNVSLNRNLIINGAMTVAQRGLDSTASGYKTIDRWQVAHSVQDNPYQMQVNVASGTTPYNLGFRKALQLMNGNQSSGAGASNYINANTRLEAQDIANSGWDYTDANSFITLSFWIKSSVAQNFYGYVKTFDGSSKTYTFETGSLTANTWTKITKTIPGNSGLTFDNDADMGFQFVIASFWGTDYTDSGLTLNQWNATNNAARTPDNTSTWFTTNDATLDITGVQLEVGSTASAFLSESYADTLAKCQRYYHNIKADDDKHVALGFAAGTGFCLFLTYFPVPMRANPTYTGSTTAARFYGQNQGANFNLSDLTFTSSDNDNPAPRMGTLFISTTSSMTAGQGGSLCLNADNGVLEFSAEL